MSELQYAEMQQKINKLLGLLRIKRLDKQRHQQRLLVLGYIAVREGGVNPSQLADDLNMARPQLTRLVDAFEEMGYITRRLDPEDKRRFLLLLTEKGRQDYESIRDADEQRCLQLCQYLGEEDSAELMRLLDRVNEFVEKEIPALPAPEGSSLGGRKPYTRRQ